MVVTRGGSYVTFVAACVTMQACRTTLYTWFAACVETSSCEVCDKENGAPNRRRNVVDSDNRLNSAGLLLITDGVPWCQCAIERTRHV